MKKNIVFGLFLLMSVVAFGQKDSIVNYIDLSGKITSKSKAYSVETIVKKENAWEVTTYYRNRKVKEKGNYLRKNKTKPIGRFYEFFRTGQLKSFFSYDANNQLTGKTQMWFNNKKTSFSGNYKEGKKIGVWKYYHYNGKIAARLYYQNTKLVKTLLYNEQGEKITAELIKSQKPTFEGGGLKKFFKRIKDIHNRINFQINGTIYLNFDITPEGKIANVTTPDKISKDLMRRLRIYFENIEGWEPAIHMNRKIPYTYTIPFNFSVRFE